MMKSTIRFSGLFTVLTSALVLSGLGLIGLGLIGCDDGNDGCVLGDPDSCNDGLVCEQVQGGEPACFTPVRLEGRVFDLATDVGIVGARVVAVDVNGEARSGVARSGEGGAYSLSVPLVRDADGNPADEALTLRVSGAGYQPFPTAPRTALPIETGGAVRMDDRWVVRNTATDVGLIALPSAAGLRTLRGRIDHEDAGGSLVVAEQGGVAVSTAIAGSDGEVTLFNVPDGTTTLNGGRSGLVIDPQTLEVSGNVEGIVLTATTGGMGTVTGSVNFVNAGGLSFTTVILGIESTFVESVARAEVPAGLRVETTGAFTFEDVPPGSYVVLAAFENDDLVRDPDEGIAGTAIVHITVGAGETVALDTSFKITGALGVFGPGADGVETITTEPTLEWADDSSEDGYELRLYDAFGNLVLEDTGIPSVSGSTSVSYPVPAGSLDPGMIYQFRAFSFRDRTGGRTYISATEDLRGVFLYAP